MSRGCSSSKVAALLGALVLACGSVAPLAGQESGGWIVRHQREGGFLWSIASNGTNNGPRLVTVGTGGRILVSTDGVVWNARAAGVNDWLVGVTYGNGRFIAVGDNGRILSSPDGDVWAVVPNVPTRARLNNVFHANNRFVAVGEGGTALVSTDNGATWVQGTTGVTGWLRGLTYIATRTYLFSPFGGGTSGLSSIRRTTETAFVATGQGGTIIASVDGLGWTPMDSGTTEDLEAVAATYSTGGYMVTALNHATAIGSSGVVRTYAWAEAYFTGTFFGYNGPPPTLPPASRWLPGSVGVSADVRLRGLAVHPAEQSRLFFSSILLASGERGIVTIAGRQENTGVAANLVAGVYHDGRFYVVGENETILQQAGTLHLARVANLSTRGSAGGARGPLIGGVAITGSVAKRVLVRAVGPGLGGFGVPGVMPAPVLTVFDSTRKPIAGNAGWANDPSIAAAGVNAGAFALGTGSRDAAILATLEPGNYTFQIEPAAGTNDGVALFEVYDVDTASNTGPRLRNTSTRGFVGANAEVLIGGFVVSGASGANVLIRGIGPSLAGFGVGDALADCAITVFRGAQAIASNDNWGTNPNATQLSYAFVQTGAFALEEDSRDAALLLPNLAPGAYTVQLSASGAATGTGLIEIYELP